MRIIAFITDGPTLRDILVHLGEPTAPPRIAPARGPPLCDLPDAGPGTFDPQPAPEYEFDQRITSHRSGQVKTCYAARDDAPCRWISYPFVLDSLFNRTVE